MKVVGSHGAECTFNESELSEEVSPKNLPPSPLPQQFCSAWFLPSPSVRKKNFPQARFLSASLAITNHHLEIGIHSTWKPPENQRMVFNAKPNHEWRCISYLKESVIFQPAMSVVGGWCISHPPPGLRGQFSRMASAQTSSPKTAGFYRLIQRHRSFEKIHIRQRWSLSMHKILYMGVIQTYTSILCKNARFCPPKSNPDHIQKRSLLSFFSIIQPLLSWTFKGV